MNTAEMKSKDPWVRRLSGYQGSIPRGLTAFDLMKQGPGRQFSRVRIRGYGAEWAQSDFTTHPDELPCVGAAVGVGADGVLRHFHPLHAPQKFAGFVLGYREPGTCVVWIRGRTVLTVREVQPTDIGKAVYALEVNAFALKPALQPAGDCQVGHVLALEGQGGQAIVDFKSASDDRRST